MVQESYQLRIVGGVCNCCLQHGINFYDGREVITPPQLKQQQNTDTSSSSSTKHME